MKEDVLTCLKLLLGRASEAAIRIWHICESDNWNEWSRKA